MMTKDFLNFLKPSVRFLAFVVFNTASLRPQRLGPWSTTPLATTW